MHCEEFVDLISGHIDRINTEIEEARLQEHLQQCEHCRTLLETYRSIDTLIAQEDALPPADLKINIMKAVEAEPKKRRSRKALFTGICSGIAAAACLAVIIISIPKLKLTSNDSAAEAADAMYNSNVALEFYADSNLDTQKIEWTPADNNAMAAEATQSTEFRRLPHAEDGSNGMGSAEPIEAADTAAAPMLIIWGAVPSDIDALADLTQVETDWKELPNGAVYGAMNDSLYARLQECLSDKPHDLMEEPNAVAERTTIYRYSVDLQTMSMIAASCSGDYEQAIYYPTDMTDETVCTIFVVELHEHQELPSK